MLAANSDCNEYCRSAALRALGYALAFDIISRESLIDFLRPLCQDNTTPPGSFFLTSLVSHICDIHPAELLKEVRNIFDEEKVEHFFISFEDVEEALARGPDECIELHIRKRAKVRIEGDIHSWISWWACFKKDNSDKSKKKKSQQKKKKKEKGKSKRASRKRQKR